MGRGSLAKAAGKVAYCGLQCRSQMFPAAFLQKGASCDVFLLGRQSFNFQLLTSSMATPRLCHQASPSARGLRLKRFSSLSLICLTRHSQATAHPGQRLRERAVRQAAHPDSNCGEPLREGYSTPQGSRVSKSEGFLATLHFCVFSGSLGSSFPGSSCFMLF